MSDEESGTSAGRGTPADDPPTGLSRAKERLLARLKDRKGRAREGLVLVEGPRALETALSAGARLRFALLSLELPAPDELAVDPAAPAPSTPDDSALGALLALLRRSRAPVIRLPDHQLAALSDTASPQGVLGVVEEPGFSLFSASEPAASSAERVLVLDAVQDPGNVGTLIRAAAAFGVERVLALDGTADPWNAKTVRASAGLVFALPVHRVQAAEALDWLEAREIPLLVADAGGRDVRAGDLPRGEAGGFALLVGNEGAGPRAECRRRAQALVALPLPAGVESLNAAVAGAVLLWALGPGAARPSLLPDPE